MKPALVNSYKAIFPNANICSSIYHFFEANFDILKMLGLQQRYKKFVLNIPII